MPSKNNETPLGHIKENKMDFSKAIQICIKKSFNSSNTHWQRYPKIGGFEVTSFV